jgi:hypothetical protein
MKNVHRVFTVGHYLVSLIFVAAAFILIAFAVYEIVLCVMPSRSITMLERIKMVLEGIALLTVAVASLELGQTIMEEEVQRDAVLSVPTRVRRFLSRFMIVLVVALSIEALVAVFQFLHEDPSDLRHAASIGYMAAALLAAWGVFLWFNRTVEQLEPEAISKVREEDQKVEDGK